MAGQGSAATDLPGAPLGETPTRGHVLVVDDDVPTARGFGRILSSAGFAVTLAHDGTEAAALASKQSFDTILSDIAMPGMSGLARCQVALQREHDLDAPGDPRNGRARHRERRRGHGVRRAAVPHQAHRCAAALRRHHARPCGCIQMARIKAQALALFHIDNGGARRPRSPACAYFEPRSRRNGSPTSPSCPGPRSTSSPTRPSCGTRSFHAAVTARPVRGGGAPRAPAGARACHPRPCRAHGGRAAPGRAALRQRNHALELDDDSLFHAGSPLSKHAKNVVLEITSARPSRRSATSATASRSCARSATASPSTIWAPATPG